MATALEVLVQTHFTPSGVRQYFIDQLAHRPRAGRTKDYQREQKRESAIKKPYIAPDQPYAKVWLKFDLDHIMPGGKVRREHAAVAWQDAGFPQPHFIMCRQEWDNLGAHYLYGAAVPIGCGPEHRYAPQQFFQAVVNGMTLALNADPAFSSGVVKNPLHPQWRTIINDAPLFDLYTLFDCLPEHLRRKPERQALVGEGRNTDLFHHLRHWAYGEVYAAYLAGHPAQWEAAVIRKAHALNGYDTRLPDREVNKTGRSVAKWTWGHATNFERRGEGIRDRSKIYSWNRPALTADEAKERMSEGALITNAKQRNQRDDRILEAIGALTARGFTQPSKRQIAQMAGVSERTVARWRAGQGKGTGN